jgi:hypothetical protein
MWILRKLGSGESIWWKHKQAFFCERVRKGMKRKELSFGWVQKTAKECGNNRK